MQAISNLAGLLLFVLECLLVLVNWMAAIQNARNRRRGIGRHVSGIALVPQVLMLLAAVSLNAARTPWLPVWLPFVVGALDITLLRMLLVLPRVILKSSSRHG